MTVKYVTVMTTRADLRLFRYYDWPNQRGTNHGDSSRSHYDR
jgi:hypothetical protein